MTLIADFFQKAQLSEASYAVFDASVFENNPDALRERLLAANNSQFKGTFSDSQATAFVSRWRVVDQYTAPPFAFGVGGTGFSGTLFQNIQSGGYVFAVRGTEPGFADLVADISDIVVDGVAMDQLVDMYNYWQRLTTSPGVAYAAARLDTNAVETAQLLALQLQIPIGGLSAYNAYVASLTSSGALLDTNLTGTATVRRITRGSSSILFAGTELAFGSGKLTGADPLDVVGHSLGGHLAAAFTRLFPLVPAQAVTVNGAGFPTGSTPGLSGYALSNIQNAFAELNGSLSFNPAAISNVHGSGPNFVTMNDQRGLVQPGSTQEVFIEAFTFDTTFGHGVGQMTDSLAMYDLFAQLDSQLRTAPLSTVNDRLKPVFEAFSVNALGSLEQSANTLVKLLGLNFSLLGNGDAREGLFTRIN